MLIPILPRANLSRAIAALLNKSFIIKSSKPNENSEGKTIYSTPEGLNNFWKWFKDSPVVDSQGRPRLMYHGTPTPQELRRFIPGGTDGSITSGDLYGIASYFTSSPKEAQSYTKGEGAIFPVYITGNLLRLDSSALRPEDSKKLSDWANENMMDADKARIGTSRKTEKFSDVEDARDFFENQRKNWEHFGDHVERLKPEVVSNSGGVFVVEYTDFSSPVTIRTGDDAFKMFLYAGFSNCRDLGYDGFIVDRGNNQIWVVLHNPDSNVKSATGNDGSFDIFDRDITSTSSEDQP